MSGKCGLPSLVAQWSRVCLPMQETQKLWVQSPAVFLPGNSHEQRSLASGSPGGCRESDMTEQTHTYIWTHTHRKSWVSLKKGQLPIPRLRFATCLAMWGAFAIKRTLDQSVSLPLTPNCTFYLDLPHPLPAEGYTVNLPHLFPS